MKTTCCFTGPRPKNYPKEYGVEEFENYIQKELTREIESAIARGYKTFITGMALGIDTIAAEIVLKKREENPDLGLKLVCAIPNKAQTNRWEPSQKEKYQEILKKGDEVIYVSEEFSVESYHLRNQYMVDKSSLLIAVDVNSRGAKQTIEYAKSKNKKIKVLTMKK